VNKYQHAVRTLMKAVGQETPKTPTLENYPFELRAKLCLEEAREFLDACGLAIEDGCVVPVDGAIPKWPEMIDAIVDLLYVTYGAAVSMGIDLDPFFAEVHAANMRKVGGPLREDGKRLKPPGWVGPNIDRVLVEARSNPTNLDAEVSL
jgi:predicted HAD superfamily Cof-like phosphohydrolase